MTLKLLQLNIFQGKLLPDIIDYIKKEDFDMLHLQEVTGGSFSKGGMWAGQRESLTTANPEAVGIDCFTEIKKQLDYEGVMNVTIAKRSDHASYFGNATFFKKSLSLIATKELFLKPYEEMDQIHADPVQAPRAALITTFSFDNKEIQLINCHLAWSQTGADAPHKIAQGKILYEYLQSVKTPFILTGDFNVDAKSKIVMWFSTLAQNLVVEHGITNTLNPHVHAAKQLFPLGLGVDFAFVTKEIMVKDFHLIDTPDLSDHYGLSLTVEI